MDKTTIEARVKDVVATQFYISTDQVKLTDNLANDHGGDSLDKVELTMELEDEFEIEIPDEDGQKFETVQQIHDYVAKRLAA